MNLRLVLVLACAAVSAHAAPDVSLNAKAVAASAPGLRTKPTLLMRGLDKITGRAFDIVAPLGTPVRFATFTITARYCYSTPQSETPETAAFVQIDDARPDQPVKRIFSGWMYASSPGLNGVQHPLYDVWAIFCRTSLPGQGAPKVVASHGPAKVRSPDATDNEGLAPLPEGADQ